MSLSPNNNSTFVPERCVIVFVSFVFFDDFCLSFGSLLLLLFAFLTLSFFLSHSLSRVWTTCVMVFQNRMSRDDHTKTTPETKASTSSSKAIISSEENDDDSSSWSRFKTKVSECFWDFEAELADWFGLNASKFYEELENEEGFGKRRRRRQTTARRTRRGRDDEDGNGNNTTRIKNRIHI